MFTVESVIEATSSAEATARYWAWRASQSGSPEAALLIRAKMNQTTARRRGEPFTDDAEQTVLADRMVARYNRPSSAAGRLAVYHALLADIELGLEERPPRRDGVLLQTDYVPLGRMEDALRGVDITGLPIKTATSTHAEFAYAAEQGEPFTIIHGDFLVAQAHLVEVHHVIPSDIVALSA